MACIWLFRHGNTAWSDTGQHTGRTDLALTEVGRSAATAAGLLLPSAPALVLSSPLQRAVESAHLAGLPGIEIDQDLLEWDYGALEGLTTQQIRQDRADPNWAIWDHRVPPGATPGEQPADVAGRCERVLARARPIVQQDQDVVLVAHAHVLRILTATWLGLPPIAARLFHLDPASVSSLGFEHQQPAIMSWNRRP